MTSIDPTGRDPSLVAFKPSTGDKLLAFPNELLRGPCPLTPAERELIAAFVSSRNDCYFRSHAHQAVASHLLGDDGAAGRSLNYDRQDQRVRGFLPARRGHEGGAAAKRGRQLLTSHAGDPLES